MLGKQILYCLIFCRTDPAGQLRQSRSAHGSLLWKPCLLSVIVDDGLDKRTVMAKRLHGLWDFIHAITVDNQLFRLDTLADNRLCFGKS